MKLHISKTNVFTGLLLFLSFLILAGTVLFTLQVKVLKDWHIDLPAGDIHAGDTITITSVYTKLKPVTGVAHRYIQCKNLQGAYIRYEINQRTADNGPGSGGTGIPLVIPKDIPNLPTECHISINIDYKVYPWRTVTEFNSTKNFTLLPAVAVTSIDSQVLSPMVSSIVSTVSSSQPTPAVQTEQPEIPQLVTPPVVHEVCTINLLGIKTNCREETI